MEENIKNLKDSVKTDISVCKHILLKSYNTGSQITKSDLLYITGLLEVINNEIL